MDDPGWAWPAWKVGLKRDDLFTSLHDQYNTFTYTIQDPEAFHHDVYELSSDANSPDEFHRLMTARRTQRLRELNESLESLAVEIIANPKLMATDQWQHALQLFRSKSFDSMVRFFASYIPDDYLDRHHRRTSSTTSSFSEANSVCTASTKASSVDDIVSAPSTCDDFSILDSIISEEPLEIQHNDKPSSIIHPDAIDAPLSPPASETAHSEDALSCDCCSTSPPSRSMSFSGSESEAFGPELIRRSFNNHVDFSRDDDCDTLATSIEDCAEPMSPTDSVSQVPKQSIETDADAAEENDDVIETTQFPEDAFDTLTPHYDTPELDLDTPTPVQEAIATCSVAPKPQKLQRLAKSGGRSPSPKPHSSQPLPHYRREGSPLRCSRRSPEEAFSRVQKPGIDAGRRRPRGRLSAQ
jgi:hypothetical protein